MFSEPAQYVGRNLYQMFNGHIREVTHIIADTTAIGKQVEMVVEKTDVIQDKEWKISVKGCLHDN